MMVSIIIPVKPGGEVRALQALSALDAQAIPFEVMVAEGRCPSRQRNSAAARARGAILYFLDDDSLVSPAALQRIVACFADPDVAAVGGPSLTPDSDSILQKSFGAAFGTVFGGGGVCARYRQIGELRTTDDSELILCNLAFRRDVFLEAGGFDERLYPNEENELMERLRARGYKLLHDPCLTVVRSQRSTIYAFIRQLLNYGRGRSEQSRLSGKVRLTAFVPAMFVIYLSLLTFVTTPLARIPLLLYLVLNLAFAVAAGVRTRTAAIGLLLLGIFPLLHIAHGAGALWGLFSRIPATNADCGEITIRQVNTEGEKRLDNFMAGTAP